MSIEYVYRNPRPLLVITHKGGARLGNCYSASYYEVVSQHSLSMQDLRSLRDAGFLGYGQEFRAHQIIQEQRVKVPDTLDWQTRNDVKPSGADDVPCIMVDSATGVVIEGEAVNPYTGIPYGNVSMSYYTYACESRVDSSD